MEKQLIWLDEQSKQVIGYGMKIDTHRSCQYHRAFSIFIFDQRQRKMLIQKRARQKYHSGGLLSNACCSHLYRGESWAAALSRCLKDELNLSLFLFDDAEKGPLVSCIFETPLLRKVGVFSYKCAVGDLFEHEEDNVFLYFPTEEEIANIRPNPNEIESLFWYSLEEIDSLLTHTPHSFTAWFQKGYEIVTKYLG